MTPPPRARYTGYRFPAEIIGHAVWLYFRFPLGLRMVEELLAARGIIVRGARPHPRRRSRVRDQLQSRAEQTVITSGRAIERTKRPTAGGPPQGRRLRSPSPVADTALYQKRLARTAPHRKAQPTQKGR